MRPTDLPFNAMLGLRDAPSGAAHLLELPWHDRLRNHVGTMHAAAQFALAEAASAECLLREFPDLAPGLLAVVRHVELRYRRAATGDAFAHARPAAGAAEQLRADLAARGRAFVTVDVELRDAGGAVSFAGKFTWYLSREAAG
ncbi:MAG TPA: DUF4442 domain-containing protein [Opitutaceae bacterium]|nr:DUF4442 domain-containing protein [Opitutaceae bacterium]